MSENTDIEHRAFWESEVKPHFTFECFDTVFGGRLIKNVCIPTREEIINEQKRRVFMERIENLLFLLSYLDFKYNVKERLKY